MGRVKSFFHDEICAWGEDDQDAGGNLMGDGTEPRGDEDGREINEALLDACKEMLRVGVMNPTGSLTVLAAINRMRRAVLRAEGKL